MLTRKVNRLGEQYCQQPWQNCVHSWNVLFHDSSSVDCGWTCQVRLQTFTWGLTRRTWWRQQEQFTYLSKKKQFTWFPCCDMKPIQEVLMTLLTFQLRIVWQIAWRSHRRWQTVWSQQWKQLGFLEVDVHPNFRNLMEHTAFLSTWCRTFILTGEKPVFFLNTWKFSLTSSTRRTIPCNVRERSSMDSESQDATKITSALANSRIHSFTKMMTLYMCVVAIFLRVSHFLSLPVLWQCRRQDLLVSAESIVGRKILLNTQSTLETTLWVSGFFRTQCVDLKFNEDVMKPERFTDTPDHAGFNPDTMRASKWLQKTILKGDVSHFSSFSRKSDTSWNKFDVRKESLLKMIKGSRWR